MKLITKEIEKAFSKQGYTGDKPTSEIFIICKIFSPCSGHTWYLYEHVEEDIYWCFATDGNPMFAECGTVSISELEEIKVPFNIRFGNKVIRYHASLERDKCFKPFVHTLKSVQYTIQNGGHV